VAGTTFIPLFTTPLPRLEPHKNRAGYGDNTPKKQRSPDLLIQGGNRAPMTTNDNILPRAVWQQMATFGGEHLLTNANISPRPRYNKSEHFGGARS
jgi:hypothetical protein